MSITMRDFTGQFSAGVQTLFQRSYENRLPLATLLATVVESSLPEETYAWLGELPALRPFTDERIARNLSEYTYTLKNIKWESTLAVQREVLEYEQYGQVRARVESLAEATANHADDLIFNLIKVGNTNAGIGYDGAPFYSDNHPLPGNKTASNQGANVLTEDALENAITVMQSRTGDNGEPMAVSPTHLLVGPALQFKARRILNGVFYPEATANIRPGESQRIVESPLMNYDTGLQLLVSPRITSPTEWHLFDLSHSVKPFLWQRKDVPQLLTLDTRGGETESSFWRDELLYGVRVIDNAGYGLWQYAYKGNS